MRPFLRHTRTKFLCSSHFPVSWQVQVSHRDFSQYNPRFNDIIIDNTPPSLATSKFDIVGHKYKLKHVCSASVLLASTLAILSRTWIAKRVLHR